MRRKKIPEPPWQTRFLAGLAPQLNIRIDREIALYLQELSSFPTDSTAEIILAKFLKGEMDFPKKWVEAIIIKCEKGFVDRWIEKLSPSQISIKEKIISPKETALKPKLKSLPAKPKEAADRNEKSEAELPQVIISKLSQALKYSLSEDGQIFIKKLMRKLNEMLSNYSVSRKGRVILFKGKRIVHQFNIPENIELR